MHSQYTRYTIFSRSGDVIHPLLCMRVWERDQYRGDVSEGDVGYRVRRQSQHPLEREERPGVLSRPGLQRSTQSRGPEHVRTGGGGGGMKEWVREGHVIGSGEAPQTHST